MRLFLSGANQGKIRCDQRAWITVDCESVAARRPVCAIVADAAIAYFNIHDLRQYHVFLIHIEMG